MKLLSTYHPFLYILLILWGGLVACTTENYPEGDDEYSYVTSDFGTITTEADCAMRVFVTDANRSLRLAKPLKTKWAATPDSTYRVLTRYEANAKEITPFSIEPIITIPVTPDNPKDPAKYDDPIHWESTWLSTNAEYINLGIALMLGTDDGEEIGVQRLRLRSSKTTTFEMDGITHSHHHLRILHDQCNVPQYYRQSTFISIPTRDVFSPGDSITITATTYKGLVSHTIVMK